MLMKLPMEVFAIGFFIVLVNYMHGPLV